MQRHHTSVRSKSMMMEDVETKHSLQSAPLSSLSGGSDVASAEAGSERREVVEIAMCLDEVDAQPGLEFRFLDPCVDEIREAWISISWPSTSRTIHRKRVPSTPNGTITIKDKDDFNLLPLVEADEVCLRLFRSVGDLTECIIYTASLDWPMFYERTKTHLAECTALLSNHIGSDPTTLVFRFLALTTTPAMTSGLDSRLWLVHPVVTRSIDKRPYPSLGEGGSLFG